MPNREDQAIEANKERLKELQARWDSALPRVAEALGIETDSDPAVMLERVERESALAWLEVREKHPERPVLLGIAGPGASGKGTLGAFLEQEEGFTKVTNTTTRQPRHYEVNGQDYFFTDEADFKVKAEAGEFLQWNEKPGRGLYGVGRDEVANKLKASEGTGCIVEESPANLVRTLGSEAVDELADKPLLAIVYILPPHPIAEVSARRLYFRSAAEEASRQLSAEDVDSTLGERQIDEFEDLRAVKDNPDVHLVVVINDNLDESQAKMSQLFAHS